MEPASSNAAWHGEDTIPAAAARAAGERHWSAPATAARDGRNRDRVSVAAAVALGLGLLLGGGGWAYATRDAHCDGRTQWLTVTADPAVVPAVLAVADRYNDAQRADGRCAVVKVVAGDSAETVTVLRQGRAVPDVWIPDSSFWAGAAGADRAAPSVASSPLVFALPQATAQRYRSTLEQRAWAGFGPAHQDADRFRLWISDPAQTGAGSLALQALWRSAAGPKRFAGTLHSVEPLPADRPLERAFGGDDDADGRPEVAAVPEQQVWRQNRDARDPAARLAVVHPAQSTPALDFPYVGVARDAGRRRVAADFLTALRDRRTAADLHRVGLRRPVKPDAPPPAGPGLPAVRAVDAQFARPAPPVLPVADERVARQVQEYWRRIKQGVNALALIDQTGPARGPRLDLMRATLAQGSSLMLDDTEFGLWTLGERPGDRPRVLAPMRPLAALRPSGHTQRLEIQDALRKVKARPGPGTGLYGAITAAYRVASRRYDEGDLNVVIVLTAGGDGGGARGDLDRTRKELAASFDPRRPVSVVVLSVGAAVPPDLRALAASTDGGAFTLRDRSQVVQLLRDSDAWRACDDPRCPD
ncbi:substrate-binding domain-containing protein [Actinomadura hibisca]|uniref:substrate-binding domain-containing protein n=1 Tax=Actinomadura hibisca TaxID=68565 RepID=UPI00082B95A9|nr:substrate-binding domain-containing protein [Actinomadura hibisca]